MKTNLFLSIALSAAIFGCGNSNYSLNSNKQSSEPLAKTAVAAVATTCTITPTIQAWNALSQTQKNTKILAVAQTMNGCNYSRYIPPVECKPWVQSYVVLPASGLTIGSNTSGNPNYFSWNSATCFNNQIVKLYSNSSSLPWVVPGQIIQMWWTPRLASGSLGAPGPHTAIVVSNTSGYIDDTKNYMIWIDCNFSPKYTVSVHKVTYADFKLFTTATVNYPQLGFSVYQIQ
ncbi:MAG: hypothetical protein PHO56_03765 [Patescibacteria group bacterium]|nr:hypothetical protein [Patescibacteria group bacterium]